MNHTRSVPAVHSATPYPRRPVPFNRPSHFSVSALSSTTTVLSHPMELRNDTLVSAPFRKLSSVLTKSLQNQALASLDNYRIDFIRVKVHKNTALGHGGFGDVWLGEVTGLEENPVAVKILRSPGDSDHRARFAFVSPICTPQQIFVSHA